jgi:outer membrane protein assembly factor BamB
MQESHCSHETEIPCGRGRARIVALATGDGSELWSLKTDNYILQSPRRQGDTLYVAGVYYDPEPVDEGGHTRLYALSAADGAKRWTYESEDGFPKNLYATDNAVAFIGYQDYVNGVSATTGELLWRKGTHPDRRYSR